MTHASTKRSYDGSPNEVVVLFIFAFSQQFIVRCRRIHCCSLACLYNIATWSSPFANYIRAGMLDRVNRYKAVSTTMRDSMAEGKRSSSSTSSSSSPRSSTSSIGGSAQQQGGRTLTPSSFHATSSIELVPSAALETHRFTYKGSWLWAKIGGTNNLIKNVL